MEGYQVYFTPGFDCHGLPIELQVLNQNKEKEEIYRHSPVELIRDCRNYTTSWIEQQKQEFIKLGILADWNRCYYTMVCLSLYSFLSFISPSFSTLLFVFYHFNQDPQYESEVLRSFASLVDKQMIERKLKTTHWCTSCKTVLSTAELEYQEKEVPLEEESYVVFPLDAESRTTFLQKISASLNDNELDVGLLVWTTSPWSLPMNQVFYCIYLFYYPSPLASLFLPSILDLYPIPLHPQALALRPNTNYSLIRINSQTTTTTTTTTTPNRFLSVVVASDRVSSLIGQQLVLNNGTPIIAKEDGQQQQQQVSPSYILATFNSDILLLEGDRMRTGLTALSPINVSISSYIIVISSCVRQNDRFS